MYIVLEKLKSPDKEYGFDVRLKPFEKLEDAILFASTAFLRVQLPFNNYDELYEVNVFELGKGEMIV